MVRVGTPSAVARPEWYDRNPGVNLRSYNGSHIAPHALAERWNYTVPAGKKAFIENFEVFIQRETAATTVGHPLAQLALTPSGGSKTVMVLLWELSNTVGEHKAVFAGQGGVLLAGDRIVGETYDDSSGGYMNFIIIAKIMEFDA